MRMAHGVSWGRLVLLAVTVVGLAGCVKQETPVNLNVTAAGTIEATVIQVKAELGGPVVELAVDEGDSVEAGQLVLKTDDQHLKLQLKQAQAALNGAVARLAEVESGARAEQIRAAEEAVNQAEAMKDQAEKNLKDITTLYQEAAATEAQLEAAATGLKAVEAQYRSAAAQRDLLLAGATSNTVKAARANVAAAQAAVDLAELVLAKATVTAPAVGVIMNKHLEKGELLAPGVTAVTIADLDKLWLRVYVAETDLGKVALGQRAVVRVDAFSERDFSGTVTYIAPQAEFTPKNLQTKEERVNMVFAVRIQLDDSGRLLKPGMPADVELLPVSPAGKTNNGQPDSGEA